LAARIAGAGAFALVIVVGILLFSGGPDHTLRAAFDNAVQLAPSQEVRIAGRKVGTITSVQEVDGQAIVKLGIDESAWPLRQGTTATARWGSTSGYALRYIELNPGPASAPTLPDNGLLGQGQAISAVELDQVYRIFRGPSRADLGGLVDELGQTFGPEGKPLARALAQSPPGLDQLAAVLDSLGADEHALGSLVTAGDRVTGALAAHDGQLGAAVGHLAQTFDTLGTRAGDIQQALERLPATLQTSTSAMKRWTSRSPACRR
jgi:virulence factor Mce-like protein